MHKHNSFKSKYRCERVAVYDTAMLISIPNYFVLQQIVDGVFMCLAQIPAPYHRAVKRSYNYTETQCITGQVLAGAHSLF